MSITQHYMYALSYNYWYTTLPYLTTAPIMRNGTSYCSWHKLYIDAKLLVQLRETINDIYAYK
jgi:hypothetical protein